MQPNSIGIFRRLFAMDARNVGILHFVLGFCAALLGAALFGIVQLELQTPGLQYFSGKGNWFNIVVSARELVTTNFAALPVLFAGFGYLFLPGYLGVKDMAIRPAGIVSFWLLVLGLALLIWSVFLSVNQEVSRTAVAGGGWTVHGAQAQVPQSQSSEILLSPARIALAALLAAYLSLVLSAVNIIATFIASRLGGARLGQIPPLAWALVVTAVLAVVLLPLVFYARYHAMGGNLVDFSKPASGAIINFYPGLPFGVALLSILMAVPAWGLASAAIAAAAGRPLVLEGIVSALLVSMGLGFLAGVLGPALTGASASAGSSVSLLIAVYLFVFVQACAVVLLWIATLVRGRVQLVLPVLWSLGFVLVYVSVGGGMGITPTGVKTDPITGDTYNATAFTNAPGYLAASFAFFAAWYGLFRQITGRLYVKAAAVAHWTVTFSGVTILFFAGYELQRAGVPWHYADYPEFVAHYYFIASIGGYLILIGVLLFFVGLVSRQQPRGIG